VPRLRMALHCGSVVTADVGVDRHKIAYFGDTVNATARIEALCRTLDAPVLASHALLAELPALPPGIVARDLGPQPVRGRGRPLSVAALERSAVRAAMPAQGLAAPPPADAPVPAVARA
jgi:adenylate cyclase